MIPHDVGWDWWVRAGGEEAAARYQTVYDSFVAAEICEWKAYQERISPARAALIAAEREVQAAYARAEALKRGPA